MVKFDFFSFLPGFLHAFSQNLWMGMLAVLIGLIVGMPLARIVHRQSFLYKLVKALLFFLRALPAFIVMYIALGVLTMNVSIDEHSLFSAPVIALLVGLCFSSISGVFDATLDYFRLQDAGQRKQALLIIPNIFRLFVNVAATTAVGAALGVKEAVSYSLLTAERLSNTDDRLFIVFFVSMFFVCFVLLSRWIMNYIVKTRLH
jgi:ABC-type proline/glycine betaine transport system permease subunit